MTYTAIKQQIKDLKSSVASNEKMLKELKLGDLKNINAKEISSVWKRSLQDIKDAIDNKSLPYEDGLEIATDIKIIEELIKKYTTGYNSRITSMEKSLEAMDGTMQALQESFEAAQNNSEAAARQLKKRVDSLEEANKSKDTTIRKLRDIIARNEIRARETNDELHAMNVRVEKLLGTYKGPNREADYRDDLSTTTPEWLLENAKSKGQRLRAVLFYKHKELVETAYKEERNALIHSLSIAEAEYKKAYGYIRAIKSAHQKADGTYTLVAPNGQEHKFDTKKDFKEFKEQWSDKRVAQIQEHYVNLQLSLKDDLAKAIEKRLAKINKLKNNKTNLKKLGLEEQAELLKDNEFLFGGMAANKNFAIFHGWTSTYIDDLYDVLKVNSSSQNLSIPTLDELNEEIKKRETARRETQFTLKKSRSLSEPLMVEVPINKYRGYVGGSFWRDNSAVGRNIRGAIDGTITPLLDLAVYTLLPETSHSGAAGTRNRLRLAMMRMFYINAERTGLWGSCILDEKEERGKKFILIDASKVLGFALGSLKHLIESSELPEDILKAIGFHQSGGSKKWVGRNASEKVKWVFEQYTKSIAVLRRYRYMRREGNKDVWEDSSGNQYYVTPPKKTSIKNIVSQSNGGSKWVSKIPLPEVTPAGGNGNIPTKDLQAFSFLYMFNRGLFVTQKTPDIVYNQIKHVEFNAPILDRAMMGLIMSNKTLSKHTVLLNTDLDEKALAELNKKSNMLALSKVRTSKEETAYQMLVAGGLTLGDLSRTSINAKNELAYRASKNSFVSDATDKVIEEILGKKGKGGGKSASQQNSETLSKYGADGSVSSSDGGGPTVGGPCCCCKQRAEKIIPLLEQILDAVKPLDSSIINVKDAVGGVKDSVTSVKDAVSDVKDTLGSADTSIKTAANNKTNSVNKYAGKVSTYQGRQDQKDKTRAGHKSFLQMLIPELKKLLPRNQLWDIIKLLLLKYGAKHPKLTALAVLGGPAALLGAANIIANAIIKSIARNVVTAAGISKGATAAKTAGSAGATGGAAGYIGNTRRKIDHINAVREKNLLPYKETNTRLLKAESHYKEQIKNLDKEISRVQGASKYQRYVDPNTGKKVMGKNQYLNILNDARQQEEIKLGRVQKAQSINLQKMQAAKQPIRGAKGTLGIMGESGKRSLIKGTAKAGRRIPFLGTAITVAAETPELIKAHKEGRFADQAIESTGSVGGALGGSLAGSAIGGIIGGALGSVIPGLGTAIGAVAGKFIGGLLGAIIGEKFGKNLAKIFIEPIKDVVKSMGHAVKGVWNAFTGVFNVIKALTALFGGVLKTIGSVVRAVFRPITAVLGGLLKTVGTVVLTFFSMIFRGIGNVFNIIGNALYSISNFIYAVVGVGKVIKSLVMQSKFVQDVSNAWKTAGEAVDNFFNTLNEWIRLIGSWDLNKIINKLKESDLGKNVKENVDNAKKGAREYVEKHPIVKEAVNGVNKVVESSKKKAHEIATKIKDVGSAINEKVLAPIAQVYNSMVQFGHEDASGVNNGTVKIPANSSSVKLLDYDVNKKYTLLNGKNMEVADAHKAYYGKLYGATMNSGYGYRGEVGVNGASKFHKGVDLAYTKNQAVNAFVGGTVESAGWISGYGNSVRVRDAQGVVHQYSHLNSIENGIKAGAVIKKGVKLGGAGNTGLDGMGVHLHYGTQYKGNWIDPNAYALTGQMLHALPQKGGMLTASPYTATTQTTSGQTMQVSNEVRSGLRDWAMETKKRNAKDTADRLVFDPCDVTGSLGCWGIVQLNNTGQMVVRGH